MPGDGFAQDSDNRFSTRPRDTSVAEPALLPPRDTLGDIEDGDTDRLHPRPFPASEPSEVRFAPTGVDLDAYPGLAEQRHSESRSGDRRQSDGSIMKRRQSELHPTDPKTLFHKGPGSVATSTASSQREIRQARYFRSLLQSKTRVPLQQFKWQMSFASIGLLGILICGCVLGILMYVQITKALDETYARARPRGTILRFCQSARMIDAIAKDQVVVPNKTAAIADVISGMTTVFNAVWTGMCAKPQTQASVDYANVDTVVFT